MTTGPNHISHLLLLDAVSPYSDALREHLAGVCQQVHLVPRLSQAYALFADFPIEAIISEVELSDGKVEDLLVFLHREKLRVPVIVLSANAEPERAARIIKAGGWDYLTKQGAASLAASRVVTSFNAYQGEPLAGDSQMRHQALLASAISDPVISFDLAGRVVFCNPAAEKLFGYEQDFLVGQPLSLIFAAGSGDLLVDLLLAKAVGNGRYSREVTLHTAAQKPFPAQIAMSRIDSAGVLSGCVMVVRDLAEQKLLEENLLEMEKLASLGKLVEGIAHEVRNPVLIMAGFANRLQQKLKEDPGVQRYVRIVIEQIQRLERMVADIEGYLQFVKDHQTSLTRIDINAFLSALVDEFAAQLPGDRKIRVVFEPSAGVPPVRADSNDLQVLFRSIMQNSIEAMAEQGTLAISPSYDHAFVSLCISDTGCGIPDDKLGEIFNPFVTSKMSGVGVGLAKAYLIVEAHGGSIDIASKPGEGTAVTVSLPVDRRKTSRTQTAA
ncbi:MAG: PAS domain S-box protein [Deltaproteobacteria bacterium]|nr:PAS domain S-box protein [Candidatus Anaeroferrophillus wilburensis]MBN2889310.1 PAS domain S-box protein [Deltaproteobacteria bacterium]